jgi:hypothetical protein
VDRALSRRPDSKADWRRWLTAIQAGRNLPLQVGRGQLRRSPEPAELVE